MPATVARSITFIKNVISSGGIAAAARPRVIWSRVFVMTGSKMADQSLLTESVVGWTIFSFILLVSPVTVDKWFQ